MDLVSSFMLVDEEILMLTEDAQFFYMYVRLLALKTK